VALLVHIKSTDQFEAMLPDIRKRVQDFCSGSFPVLTSMDLAEPPPFIAMAEKTAGGWTVDGVEMVDILSP
jgi:hypothetical protein